MKPTNQKLLIESKRLKKTADRLLADSGLVTILGRYGQVTFHGGYAADLLMNGDIDIYVVSKSFTKKSVLKIFNAIVKSTTFNSYWLADYKKFTHKRGIFPNAYYIGLKTRVNGEKWKIDIWFFNPNELKKLEQFDIDKSNITHQQKLAILELKAWRNKYNPKISGHHIYQAILENNVKTIAGLKKFIKAKYPKIWQKELGQ